MKKVGKALLALSLSLILLSQGFLTVCAEEPTATPEPGFQAPIVDGPSDSEDTLVIEEVTTSEASVVVVSTSPEDVAHPQYGVVNRTWSIVNLICAVASMILAIAILTKKTTKEEEIEDDEGKVLYMTYRRSRVYKVVSIALGIVTVFIFSMTQPISGTMVIFDEWTLIMLGLALASAVAYIMGIHWREEALNS